MVKWPTLAGMRDRPYPSDLTDEQWACLAPLLPPGPAPGHPGRPRTVDLRTVVNAILYVTRTGCQWAALPRDLPNPNTVYWYYRKWLDDGTWEAVLDALRRQVRHAADRLPHPSVAIIDSQSVKTTKGGWCGYDAGKKVNGRKRHILVDTLGLLLVVVVTAASTSDPAGARLLFARMGGAGKKLRRIWVDGTYRGKLVDWALEHCQFLLQPVLRSDDMKGFVVLPRRWVVERTFAWLTQCRRLSKDYEGLTRSSEAMIHIAMIRLMVRRLAAA